MGANAIVYFLPSHPFMFQSYTCTLKKSESQQTVTHEALCSRAILDGFLSQNREILHRHEKHLPKVQVLYDGEV